MMVKWWYLIYLYPLMEVFISFNGGELAALISVSDGELAASMFSSDGELVALSISNDGKMVESVPYKDVTALHKQVIRRKM